MGAPTVYNDIFKSRALGLYIKNAADISRTYKQLKEECENLGDRCPSQAVLKSWESENKWGLWYERAMNTLQAEAASSAIAEMRKNLRILTTLKTRLMEEIIGEQDEEGNYVRAPVGARSLESCANSLVKIMGAEISIFGVAGDTGEGESPILKLLRSAMTSAEVAQPDPSGDSGTSES